MNEHGKYGDAYLPHMQKQPTSPENKTGYSI